MSKNSKRTITDAVSSSQLTAKDGRTIPYVLSGPSGATPTRLYVLLHGLGENHNEYADFYQRLAARLADAGHAVLRIDFPAHGLSSAPPETFTLLNCIADAITATQFGLSVLHDASLHVFGTSFGAGPAVVTGSVFQELLGTVTLLAPAISYRELYLEPRHPDRAAKYGDFLRDALLRDATIPIMPGVAFNWRNALEFAVADVGPHLRRVESRTAIIHGDSDSIVPVDLSRAIARSFPSIALTVVPAMEHGFTDRDDDAGVGEKSRSNFELILRTALR